MPQFELVLPKMGESVAEATIIKWLKQPGDIIKEDETVVEIATDKVDSEVPSPVSGKLIKFLFSENDIVQVGEVIALIEIEANNSVATTTPTELISPALEPSNHEDKRISEASITDESFKSDDIPGLELTAENKKTEAIQSSSRFYSPLVRSIAMEEGIVQEELDRITGTGAEGRVTKQDILDFVAQRQQSHIAQSQVKASPEATNKLEDRDTSIPQSFAVSGSDEIFEMDRMRKLIAEHMVNSVQVAPHVTSFVESDVTNIVRWRERNKAALEQKIGEKLTYTPIFVQAVARAIRDFPMINISLNGTQITKKADVNIGIASALPSGNLIVPVIKKADQLNLIGLTKAVNDIAARSKTNKLQPDEVKDGTFTITNIGSFGNIMGTPIINQPQVAILAIGAIQKKPAVIETETGDVIAIRHKMYMSLSYDHRIVDGALGGKFLKRISDYLEAWDINYQL